MHAKKAIVNIFAKYSKNIFKQKSSLPFFFSFFSEEKLKMTISEDQRDVEAPLLLPRKNQNDINECRITVVVLFSTFVSVCGSFCYGCAVSQLIDLHFFGSKTTTKILWFMCYLGFGFLQAGYSSVAQSGITTDLGLSVAQVRNKQTILFLWLILHSKSYTFPFFILNYSIF